MTETLATGLYWVTALCPTCHQPETVPVLLTPVLTTPEDGPANLRIKAKTKAVDHLCNQARVDITTGELFEDAQ